METPGSAGGRGRSRPKSIAGGARGCPAIEENGILCDFRAPLPRQFKALREGEVTRLRPQGRRQPAPSSNLKPQPESRHAREPNRRAARPERDRPARDGRGRRPRNPPRLPFRGRPLGVARRRHRLVHLPAPRDQRRAVARGRITPAVDRGRFGRAEQERRNRALLRRRRTPLPRHLDSGRGDPVRPHGRPDRLRPGVLPASAAAAALGRPRPVRPGRRDRFGGGGAVQAARHAGPRRGGRRGDPGHPAGALQATDLHHLPARGQRLADLGQRTGYRPGRGLRHGPRRAAPLSPGAHRLPPLRHLPDRRPAEVGLPAAHRRPVREHRLRVVGALLLQHRPEPGRDPDAPAHDQAGARPRGRVPLPRGLAPGDPAGRGPAGRPGPRQRRPPRARRAQLPRPGEPRGAMAGRCGHQLRLGRRLPGRPRKERRTHQQEAAGTPRRPRLRRGPLEPPRARPGFPDHRRRRGRPVRPASATGRELRLPRPASRRAGRALDRAGPLPPRRAGAGPALRHPTFTEPAAGARLGVPHAQSERPLHRLLARGAGTGAA